MSLSSGEVILLALIDVMTNKHLDDARERMRENIDADLSDIAKAINLERIGAEKRCRENILCTWFIGGLFSYDYHLARRTLVKCIALNPCRQITPEQAQKWLSVLWGGCQLLFKNDFSSHMNEIDRYLETEKEMGEDALPFM